MRPHRSMLSILALLALAGPMAPAWGQVAAPRLADTGSAVVPPNPAVLQWSLTGLLGLDTQAHAIPAVDKTTGQLDHAYWSFQSGVGLRLSWPKVSLALQSEREATSPYHQTTGYQRVRQTGQAALAFRFWAPLALGISHQANSLSEVNTPFDEQRNQNSLGASFQYYGLFAGLALGQESIQYNNTTNSALSYSANRPVTRYGLAYENSLENPFRIHLEAIQESAGSYNALGASVGRLNRSSVVFELKLWGLTLSHEYQKYTAPGFSGSSAAEYNGARSISALGYVPILGFSILSGVERDDRQLEGSTLHFPSEHYFLALGFAFL